MKPYLLILTLLLCSVATLRAQLVANAGNDQTMCIGPSFYLGGNPTASGGTPPYQYNWTNSSGGSGASTANPLTSSNVLGAGIFTYTLVVTDAQSNIATDEVIITITDVPVITGNVSNVWCGDSLNNGAIDITVQGGMPPYSYVWNNGSTTEDQTNLSAGVYTVTVTTGGGCAETETYQVGSSQNISLSYSYISTLPGLCDSTKVIAITGGVPPYTYVWANAPAGPALGLCAAEYNVTVVDAYGCTATGSAAITNTSISGQTYFDENENCIADDSTQINQLGIKHSLYQGGVLVQEALSYYHGYYSFDVSNLGSYQVHVDTANLPFTIVCPANGVLYDTLTVTDSIHFNRNFALRCKPGFDLIAKSISTGQIFRPANNTTVEIYAGDLANFYNANCAHGIAGTVTVTINGPVTYIGPAASATTPTNVSGNVLTWNIADFGTANALNDFNIVVRTDTFAQIGQQACFTVKVTPMLGDRDSSNNTLTHCFPIVNSYDPNDKTSYPNGDIDTAQEWLTYRVRFQNTGNAEAQHIYIMDTLDTDVDASTFQLLAYSHQPNVQINENIVRFNFPNINLPDSFTNEPGSHGYVQYKVKLNENLPIGTTIENTAHIYFDFNAPVVTNTTTNTIAIVQDTTGVGIGHVNALAMNLYPNPAHSRVTVTTTQAGHTIYMYTAQGQLLATQAMNGMAATLDIALLPSGIYYIEISSKLGTARKKLVKL